MHLGPFASDVMRDVATGLRGAIRRAQRAGIARSRLLIDPGIGFGKKYEQNFEVLRHLPELARLGCPLVVGTSRKVFVGWALAGKGEPWPAAKRLWGTAHGYGSGVGRGAYCAGARRCRNGRCGARVRTLSPVRVEVSFSGLWDGGIIWLCEYVAKDRSHGRLDCRRCFAATAPRSRR